MAIRYVNGTALGTGDGSSAANADNMTDIDAQIALAGPGGEVVILTGTHSGSHMNNALPIYNGGTVGQPVTIRGQAPTGTILRGNRAEPWTTGAVDGDPFFRLHASNLVFRDLRFERFGNGAIHVWADQNISNIALLNWTADNVQRVVEVAGTVNGFTISDGVVNRYSKGFGRFAGDSNDIHITNVTGDAVVGDAIPFGLQFTGTAHDFWVTNCHLHGNVYTGSPYYNGDGFVTEETTYDGHWTDCSSNDNTDGAWDIKGGTEAFPHRLLRCSGARNKRTFRCWGWARLEDCTGTDPILPVGSTGTQDQLHGSATSAHITAINCTFTDNSPATNVYHTEAGTGIINAYDCVVTKHASATLTLVGVGSQINILTGEPPNDPTGATAGTPGLFTPSGSDVPANLTTLQTASPAIVASPSTYWATGQYVQPADSTTAHWDGDSWVAGVSPGPSGGGPVDWTDITGKPSAFPPSEHDLAHVDSFSELDHTHMGGDGAGPVIEVTVVDPVDVIVGLATAAVTVDTAPLQTITVETLGAGPPGSPGTPGVGVPVGGFAGQVLTKDTTTDYDTSWQNVPAGGVVDWVDITNKPTLFPPVVQNLNWLSDVNTSGQAEGNVLTRVGAQWIPQAPAAGGAVAWTSITGKPSTFPPDEHDTAHDDRFSQLAHTHAYAALEHDVDHDDRFSLLAHTHAAPDWADIANKPATFTPTVQNLNWLSDVNTAGQAEGNILVRVGGQWIPQAPGAGGGVRTFEATFASPLTEWVVTHNFGSTKVEVNCYDPTGVIEYDPEIEITNTNTVTVKWFYATAGIARVIG